MNSDANIRAQLGLKQKEMAMLLGVSRGHWSMFESGKRQLPPQATKLLAEILSNLQYGHASKQRPTTIDNSELYKLELERLLKENHYQTLLLERRIKAIKKKQLAVANLSTLAEIVDRHNQTSKAGNVKPIPVLRQSKTRTSDIKCSAQLITDELKLELLALEKKFLNSKIASTERDSPLSAEDSARR